MYIIPFADVSGPCFPVPFCPGRNALDEPSKSPNSSAFQSHSDQWGPRPQPIWFNFLRNRAWEHYCWGYLAKCLYHLSFRTEDLRTNSSFKSQKTSNRGMDFQDNFTIQPVLINIQSPHPPYVFSLCYFSPDYQGCLFYLLIYWCGFRFTPRTHISHIT